MLSCLLSLACGDGDVLVLGDLEPPRYRFDPPEVIAELSAPAKTDNPSLTADLLEIYFTSERGGGAADIFVAERPDRSAPFASLRRVDELSADGVETSPAVSADGLTLWFASDRADGPDLDIWVATRGARSAVWSAPGPVAALNSSGNEIPRPPGQGARVMPMASDREESPFNYRIQFAARSDSSSPFESPRLVPELELLDESVVDAFLTDDGLTLFYVAGPAFGPADLYVAARRSTDDPFEHYTRVDELSTPSDERDPWLSPDGSELYFSSDRSGRYEIYVAAVRKEPASL